MDMLKKGSITFLILFFCSCNSVYDKIFKTDIVKEYYRQNFNNYKLIYDACNDSLITWANDSLEYVDVLMINPFMVDSAIIFNTDTTLLFTTLNISSRNWKNSEIADPDALNGS